MKFKTRLLLLALSGVGVALARRALSHAQPYDFRGRSVLITGGSRGLGLVLARELADQGALLTIVARDADELERARAQLALGRHGVLACTCHVWEQG